MSTYDVALVGSGIASTTLATILHELNPKLKIILFEQQEELAGESTLGWNNAGTGHAAYCELNYTPSGDNKEVTVEKAQHINEAYEISLQFWAYLVDKGIITDEFIHQVPHMSFVWGQDNVEFLKKRHLAMTEHEQFSQMNYSEDMAEIAQWAKLIINGRDSDQLVAATKVDIGTDVDYGKLTRDMLDHLAKNPNFEIHTHTKVTNVRKVNTGWRISALNTSTRSNTRIDTHFIFVGAGGASLELLQKSRIPEAKKYAAFPVSGQFLLCRNPSIVAKHNAKVYGIAEVNAPPMSVPHLDTRYIDGKKVLLFGPFAGATTQFLKQSSKLDLLKSLKVYNVLTVLKVGVKNLSLIKYLIKEVMHSHNSRMDILRKYYPKARNEDWKLLEAGKRVQIIKQTDTGATLQFGTEVVSSADGSFATLLGASPGASTIAQIAIEIIQKSFAGEFNAHQDKIKEMIPSCGESLIDNDELLKKVRAEVLQKLGICAK